MSDSAKVRLTMREGARRLACSLRYFYSLAYSGEVETYFAAGHRWVDEDDIDKYFERQKAKGPQFQVIGFATGKQRPGRPKKPKPEAAAASAG